MLARVEPDRERAVADGQAVDRLPVERMAEDSGDDAGFRRGARDEDGQDVDHLTSEDEETWFEGAEDATPPVWE